MENPSINSCNHVEAVQKILKPTLDDNTIPLSGVKNTLTALIAREPTLSLWIKYKLIVTFYTVVGYVSRYRGVNEDSFSVYWHHKCFAKYFFQKTKYKRLIIISTPISSLTMPSGELFIDYMTSIAGEALFDDKDVAIYGGVSRLALKLLAVEQGMVVGVKAKELLQSELPINDIDTIINQKAFTGEPRCNQKSWWAIIVNDIESEIESILETRDCTFNQSLIYKGRLYYTQKALEASSTGSVVFLARDGDIFGKTVTMLKDGKQYINKNGLYRALGYLVRGKAKRLFISKENLELEAPKIGKLWVRLLMKKIISVSDTDKRRHAINNWFNSALKLKVTTAASPKIFLEELLTKFPERREYNFSKKISFYDFEGWSRLFIKRTVDSIVETYVGSSDTYLPQGLSDKYVTVDGNFFKGKSHNTEELLDFIEELNERA